MIRKVRSSSNEYALVTGAARRVGRTIALALSRKGLNLLLHYRHARNEARKLARELSDQGSQVSLLSADLATRRGIASAQQKLKDFPGKISLFVHNASVFQAKPFSKVSYEDLHENFHVHTYASFLLTQALVPKGLRLAIFVVDWATERPYRNFSPYLASKGALRTLTRVLAVELSPEVRVNAIAPGPVLPPEDYDPDRLARKTLLQRVGSPEDIAKAVLFLLDSPFITGEVLTVDGGRRLWEDELFAQKKAGQ